MSGKKASGKQIPIIPCGQPLLTKQQIADYAHELQAAAHTIGSHGLDKNAFSKSGLFQAAVEKLRGSHAATMTGKKDFLAEVLGYLEQHKKIKSWSFTGSGERHDYIIKVNNKIECAVEQKGCLDGNNTNIFKRPPNANEFLVWSLCPNPGSDMQHNAWSGIHTRLGAEIIDKREAVDALIIWDYLCGSEERPCPKLAADPTRATKVGSFDLPPPCIYLFPRTIPDPRNNPKPATWDIDDIKFIRALYDTFHCNDDDVVHVSIETRMHGNDVQRKTTFVRSGVDLTFSKWAKINRSK